MKPPTILINYKLYNNSYGDGAIAFSKVLDRISKEFGVEIIISVPATMLNRISNEIAIPVYAQHIDSPHSGQATGSITAELIKEAGASGSILNHSEKPMRLSELSDSLITMKELGLESVVCLDRYELVSPISLLRPTAILIEPPELIGSGRAISKEKPEFITRAITNNRNPNDVFILAGAGIVSGEDVYRSLKLGADGAAMASAVMKSENPERAARELVEGVLKVRGERALDK